jgi:ribonucleoside-triphosphate reductase
MDELLANGFKTRQVFIRPAGSVNTALQLIAVLFQLQSLQQFGGVAATHIDWTLVPYVRKSFMKHYIIAYMKSDPDFLKIDLPEFMFEDYQDESGIWRNMLEDWIDAHKEDFFKKTGLTKDDFYFDNKTKLNKALRQSAVFDTIQEVKQGVEGLLHNLNSLQSRSGNQLPFSSINYGTCTEEEGRIVTKAILAATIKGNGNGQTSIFPCQIFQKKKGVNDKGSKNYDLYQTAIRSTAKRMYPNYVNCDWSGDVGYNENDPRCFPSTMGCRTWNGTDINAPDEAHKHMKDGRGNIAPATIILPTLAMEAKRKAEKAEHSEYAVEYFMDILTKAIEDCRDELIERYNWICAQNPASAKFMYENHTFFSYGDEFEKEGIRGVLKHGSLAIGQIGLSETLYILIGEDQCSPKGMELAKQIEQLYKDKCAEYKQAYKLNFGVYYTPAENLCYTSMLKFRKKYGLIENVSARMINGKLEPKEYFTNSIHVPVYKEVSPFEKIDIESQLTGYSNAGCITYVEIGDNAENNLTALEQIVDYAMAKDIPYFALNVRLSECNKCGYNGFIAYNEPCPRCGASHEYIADYARITGYLSVQVSQWNRGKQCEGKDRYVHVNKLKGWVK